MQSLHIPQWNVSHVEVPGHDFLPGHQIPEYTTLLHPQQQGTKKERQLKSPFPFKTNHSKINYNYWFDISAAIIQVQVQGQVYKRLQNMTQICTNSNVSLLTFVATAEAAAVRMSVITIPSTIFNSNSVNENQYKIKSTKEFKGTLTGFSTTQWTF